MRCEEAVAPEALARVRAPLAALCPDLTDPPVIQPLSLMLDLVGESMRARLFIVQDEGGREACLRPDFTVAIARRHLMSGAVAGRYRYEGRAFRVAPANLAGDHPEEFMQAGVEAYGEAASPDADAEIAAAAWAGAAAGGRRDLRIRFGDVGLFAGFLESIEVRASVRARLQGALARPKRLEALLERAGAGAALSGEAAQIAGLSREAAIAGIEALWAQRGLEPVGGRTAADIAERLISQGKAAREPRLSADQAGRLNDYLALSGSPADVCREACRLGRDAVPIRAASEAWTRRLALLDQAGVDVGSAVLVAHFSRVFGYYDGFLFEVLSDALGPDAPVAAGGRYDGLMAAIGGAPTTAVGCMVRPARAVMEAGR